MSAAAPAVAAAVVVTDEGPAAVATTGSDQEIRWAAAMAAAQTGDEVAYRGLLEELLPWVRRQVRARIAESADAEDVVQNALIAIHRGRHTYRSERPFTPWMRTIVRHCMIDWFRQRGRRVAREVAVEAPELFAKVPDRADLPPSEANALDPVLAEALAELPGKQREAVELIQLEGLSVVEAAVRAGVTPGALKVRAHRGYRALRAKLAGTEGVGS